MKGKTAALISLIAVLLLAGIVACKQEVTPEKQQSKDPIPRWEKNEDGLQNLPDINTSEEGTGVTEALVNGLKNPPELKNAKNLVVMVCEGLTTELIESSASQYGDLILKSLPVKGSTTSKFSSSESKTLVDLIINDLYKTKTGIVSWGEMSANSMRRMTTADGNDVSKAQVSFDQFMLNPPIVFTMGKADFSKVDSDADKLNDIYKASAVITSTLEEAISLYRKDDYHFYFDEGRQHDGSVKKLYTVFGGDESLPSFRQETAFSLAWMQSVMDSRDGFALLMSYSPSSALNGEGVQDFDEGVAVAVKFVLENPDTVLLVCGCPVDGSASGVCFYGLGKGVSVQSTLYDCVELIFQ
ncbi:MAG: hypothetical protein IJ863_06585 [Spirochaetales bacterium]|nr:hypothetical protein [Spirochaetales bacterium]